MIKVKSKSGKIYCYPMELYRYNKSGRKAKEWTEDEVSRFRVLFESNMTYEIIGKIFGVSRWQIYYLTKKLGISRRIYCRNRAKS